MSQSKLSARERKNMKALSLLLNEDEPKGRIMKAKIMRELSRFEEAVSPLSFPMDKDLSAAADFIKNLALKMNPAVTIVWGLKE